MNYKEKIKAIQCLLDNPDNVGAYYKLLEDMGDLEPNYRDYMTTAPIDCDVELERVPTADWDLACALLTMLVREDHFDNGSFMRRQRKGQIDAILNRMIELQKNLSNEELFKQALVEGVNRRIQRVLDSCEELNSAEDTTAETMKFYKQKRGDSIWWVDTSESHGLWLFSFDKKQVYNMFTDYPNKLTPEQKAIFDKENPFWANFFKDL